MKTTEILLAKRPIGKPTIDDFQFKERVVDKLKDGEVLLQSLYVSVDPYMRSRMSDAKSYVAPYELGQPISGGVVAVVKQSKSRLLATGDKVLGMLPWATHSISQDVHLRKVDDRIPLSYYLGIAGMPGLTAYFGITDICNPKSGETVVISGAAGAVGTVAGQIAKIRDCKVVGIAGGKEKCRLLIDKFNFDAAIDYKQPHFLEELKKACPDGVDCYYDNVGGEITDAVVSLFNKYARMALCGQISLYNETKQPIGPRILPTLLKTSSLVKGFIVSDYKDHFEPATKELIKWIQSEKLTYTETILEGFEQIPHAFIGLFDGVNKGKMIVKL